MPNFLLYLDLLHFMAIVCKEICGVNLWCIGWLTIVIFLEPIKKMFQGKYTAKLLCYLKPIFKNIALQQVQESIFKQKKI